MSGDSVAALAEGMVAARQSSGGGGGGGGKGSGAKRSSMDGPSQHDSTEAARADAAAEALGEELWGLMDLLVDHLYDPDEQVRALYYIIYYI